MATGFKIPRAASTLRVLSQLLNYPDVERRKHLPEFIDALEQEKALDDSRHAELTKLIQSLHDGDAYEVEAAYVDTFDRGRSTSLHLFEHVHGDSRDRGPAMVDLVKLYEAAGLYLDEGELPDFLPVVLEYASTQPPRQARAFIGEFAHILNAMFNALQQRRSGYAVVLAALLELAGEKVSAVHVESEPDLDESWTEPEVFGGCSSAGQSRPDQPQPVHFIHKHNTSHIGAAK